MSSAPHMVGLSDDQLDAIVSKAWSATIVNDRPISELPARIKASVLAPTIRIDRPSMLRRI